MASYTSVSSYDMWARTVKYDVSAKCALVRSLSGVKLAAQSSLY